MTHIVTAMRLTDSEIQWYLQEKLAAGVSSAAVAKYKTALYHLHDWLGDDKQLSAVRLQAWRASLDAHGYGKITVQKYVTIVNDFLRTAGQEALCIPKPMRADLTGRTYGYLTVLFPTDKRRRKDILWHCQCRCGKEVEVPAVLLKSGNTTSCGCLKPEILQYANRYQGGTELRQSMTEVILNPDSASGYVGVQPKRGKWAAYITYKGKTHSLGTFSRIEDAVKARARAKEAVMEDAARIYEETDHLYGDAPHRPPRPEKELAASAEPPSFPALRSNNTSGCPGVCWSKGKWSVKITHEGVSYRLGTYFDLQDAIAVRRKAEQLILAGDFASLRQMSTNKLFDQTMRKLDRR